MNDIDKPMNQTLRIGPWLFQPELGQLSQGATRHHLPPRLVRLLCVLASRPDHVWRREALIDGVWGSRPVNEEALSRAISQLRQLLGDDAAAPRYIATVPKVGYRLLMPVQVVADTAEDRTPVSRAGFESDAEPQHVSSGGTARVARSPGRSPWLLAAIGVIALAAVAALWRYDTDGGEIATLPGQDLLFSARRVTASPGVERFVELSPDGGEMAYVAVADNRYAIHLVATTDSDQQVVIASEYSQLSPVFSPDGSHLAVAEWVDDHCEVVVLERGGELRRRLGSCVLQGLVPVLDWSPDGRYLAVSDRDPATGSSAIWRIDLNDGEREQLTRPPDSYYHDARPRFSPDQRHLSFTRGTPAYRELFLLTFEASHGARQLTADRQYSVSHDWLPDSRGILFDSDRDGERGLWLLRGPWFDGEDVSVSTQPLALGARGSQYPSIASEQGALAFQVAQYEANLWRFTSGNAPTALVQSTKYDSHPAYSPDGSQLAFTSNRSGKGAIWLSDAEGNGQRKLYEPETGRAAWPSWSPQGDALLFVHYEPDGQWLSRLDLTALTAKRLPLPHQGFGAEYSADGQWITYTALVEGEGTQIWRLAADLASPPQPYSPLGANRGLMGEDQALYFTRTGQDGIFIQQEGVDEAFMLSAALSAANWASWTLRGEHLYFVGSVDGVSGLWQFNIHSGDEQLLSERIPTALGPNLSVHPDKTHWIMAMTDRAEADLFILPQFSRLLSL